MEKYSDLFNDYLIEKDICKFLGLEVAKDGYISAYYGSPYSKDGKPTGWQVVCHISKLKMYLKNRIHKEHK